MESWGCLDAVFAGDTEFDELTSVLAARSGRAGILRKH